MPAGSIKRTAFVSHSHLHESENKVFLREFGSVFHVRHIGPSKKNHQIKSNDTDYVMGRIRNELIQSRSTVTIFLVGNCMYSRRYVNWEIKAFLQQEEGRIPNGLLAIHLPSCPNGAFLPPEMELSWRRNDAEGYAHDDLHPRHQSELCCWVEEAFESRNTITDRIENPHETMFDHNLQCHVCGVTH